jgi:Icc-related predicted phosphoesterase
MITLEELHDLARDAYTIMESRRFTVFGLVDRKTKVDALAQNANPADESKSSADETLAARIKKMPQHLSVIESEKLKSLVDILVICAQVETLDMTPLEGYKALQKLIISRQTFAMSLLFGDFLAKYNDVAKKAEDFINERSEQQLLHKKSPPIEIADVIEEMSSSSDLRDAIAQTTAEPLQPTPSASSAPSIDISAIEALQAKMGEKLAALELELAKSAQKDAKIKQLEDEISEIIEAYAKTMATLTELRAENHSLKKSLAVFSESQVDVTIISDRLITLSREHQSLTSDHKALLETSEKQSIALQATIQKTRAELKIAKERLEIESKLLESHRNTNDRSMAKITSLTDVNDRLIREKTIHEQRIKFLEGQIKKQGGAAPTYSPNRLFPIHQQYNGNAESSSHKPSKSPSQGK